MGSGIQRRPDHQANLGRHQGARIGEGGVSYDQPIPPQRGCKADARKNRRFSPFSPPPLSTSHWDPPGGMCSEAAVQMGGVEATVPHE